ncbi:MAG: hypothetical protein GXY44_00005 [Phycisphaerales bacterium]|nr:hypothetical protein [Phycisphaerales bacterium]
MGNIDADPLMVLGTYTFTAGSPAIDAGDNAAVPEDNYTDLTGSLRILDGTGDGLPVVDMGAFEYVFEPGPAFTLLAAVSRKVHGQAGAFDIDLPLDSAAAGLEPRAGGPTMIVLAFSDDLDPAVSCANILLSSGVCEGVTVVENEMAMALSDVTGNTCLSLALGGIVSATGVPLSGAAEVRIRVLLGKVDNDESGMVTISDLSAIKSQLFQPVTADTFRCDVHSDAVIDIRDLSATKSNLFGSVSCP